MRHPDPPFWPVRTRDGYLPLGDPGLIGDGPTVALAGQDGRHSGVIASGVTRARARAGALP